MKRVGINGFGRTGKLIARLISAENNLMIVGINSRADPANFAYLMKYDTVYDIFPKEVGFDSTKQRYGSVESTGKLLVDGGDIPCFQEIDPAQIPWAEVGAEIVVEATGEAKRRGDVEKHLHLGEQLFTKPSKVLLTCPGKKAYDVDVTIVLGVNDQIYDPDKHRIVSNASCTTNCLAPVAKVLNDEFGIEYGFMTTVHAVTQTQRLLDGSDMKEHRRGRSGAYNVLPSTTGAAKSIGVVIPELEGKLKGMSIRVPVPSGSLVYLVTKLSSDVSVQDVNAAFSKAQEGTLKGYLHATRDEVVSSDITKFPLNTFSAVVSLDQTDVVGGLVQTLAWYDNEMAYARRVVETVKKL